MIKVVKFVTNNTYRKMGILPSPFQISQRYAEIINPKDILTLMYSVRGINNQLLDKLEDRALGLYHKLTLWGPLLCIV